jgi:hypothetical protein
MRRGGWMLVSGVGFFRFSGFRRLVRGLVLLGFHQHVRILHQKHLLCLESADLLVYPLLVLGVLAHRFL